MYVTYGVSISISAVDELVAGGSANNRAPGLVFSTFDVKTGPVPMHKFFWNKFCGMLKFPYFHIFVGTMLLWQGRHK